MADPMQPAARAVTSKVLPAPRFRYTPVLQAGPNVWISGMVALDPATQALAGATPAAQLQRILQNLDALLTEQGWSRHHVVMARIYCTDFAAFAEVNQVWDAFFTQAPLPARSAVGATALPLGATVEVEFQLWLPGQ